MELAPTRVSRGMDTSPSSAARATRPELPGCRPRRPRRVSRPGRRKRGRLTVRPLFVEQATDAALGATCCPARVFHRRPKRRLPQRRLSVSSVWRRSLVTCPIRRDERGRDDGRDPPLGSDASRCAASAWWWSVLPLLSRSHRRSTGQPLAANGRRLKNILRFARSSTQAQTMPRPRPSAPPRPAGGADADDGAGDGVGGRDRHAEVGGEEQGDGAAGLGAEALHAGDSRVIFEPMVCTMRQPPNRVPSAMAAWQASTTHKRHVERAARAGRGRRAARR